mmetsp:Transcript_35427/g.97804  ORF Transcript_35427/g.97804 Transcript_35427/m.97804 type:complete len:210 (-) Transcript_35427:1025-1654(-)
MRLLCHVGGLVHGRRLEPQLSGLVAQPCNFVGKLGACGHKSPDKKQHFQVVESFLRLVGHRQPPQQRPQKTGFPDGLSCGNDVPPDDKRGPAKHTGKSSLQYPALRRANPGGEHVGCQQRGQLLLTKRQRQSNRRGRCAGRPKGGDAAVGARAAVAANGATTTTACAAPNGIPVNDRIWCRRHISAGTIPMACGARIPPQGRCNRIILR